MDITKSRHIYKPFEYEQAYKYWKTQQTSHWLAQEANLNQDVMDWNFSLTESERKVLGQILKSFVQSEIHVEDYWSTKVMKWFPKPEIQMMAATFAAFESIHIDAYDSLNAELKLDDYEAFLTDQTAVAKLQVLKDVRGNSKKDIARSLAIFSGFTEGVNLFSSFAILANMARFGLMRGVKNIIDWSRRDEGIHSEAGCWLFRTFIKENPSIWDDELKRDIYEAARLSVKLEDDFIDNAFSLGEIRGLEPSHLKSFIRNRANYQLRQLGLKNNWKNINQEDLAKMDWFELLQTSISNTDFFSTKVTEYAKVGWKIEEMFDV